MYKFHTVLIHGRRVLEEDEHAAARKALNAAVDAACDKLMPEVAGLSPNDLYLALYSWVGCAQQTSPNAPIRECSTRGVLQRSFQRMMNHALLDEIDQEGGFAVLPRDDFRGFEHVSRRRRWSLYQLERARTVFVPRTRRQLRDVLDLL